MKTQVVETPSDLPKVVELVSGEVGFEPFDSFTPKPANPNHGVISPPLLLSSLSVSIYVDGALLLPLLLCFIQKGTVDIFTEGFSYLALKFKS